MHEPADAVVTRFKRDGFVAGVPILDSAETAGHRARMLAAEASFGHLHYQAKVYTILRSPLELATHPRVLDVVKALIGPNCCCGTRRTSSRNHIRRRS